MKHNGLSSGVLRAFAVLAGSVIVCGQAFAATQRFADLLKFDVSPGGWFPYAGLITDGKNLYGTTTSAAPADTGIIFELTPPSSGSGPWTERVLYTFKGGSDGYNPMGSLVRDSKGNLYGTTQLGGAVNANCFSGCGTVFELSPPTQGDGSWTEATLYQFQGGTDGADSTSTLIFDAKGNLYGNTPDGGPESNCCGTVFVLSPSSIPGGAWTHAVLYDFTGGDGGRVPLGGLYLDPQGNLYGTTDMDGLHSSGIVYQLSPPSSGGSWTETVLYAFTGGIDGGFPDAGVIEHNGVLYGTTSYGGDISGCGISGFGQGCGVVFELTRAKAGAAYTVLYTFKGLTDGDTPSSGGLAVDANGNLYGSTSYGGDNNNKTCQGSYYDGCGVVFKLSPPQGDGAWIETILHTFEATDGWAPNGALLLSHSALWGMTNVGGDFSPTGCPDNGCGVVFAIAAK
jgi:uncharacterized protein YceK